MRQLNAQGHRTWQQRRFTNKTVAFVRRTYGIKSSRDRLLAKGFRTAADIAKELDVSVTTVNDLGRAGVLRRRHYGDPVRCLYEPVDGLKLIRGVPGRNPKPAQIINARKSKQEAV